MKKEDQFKPKEIEAGENLSNLKEEINRNLLKTAAEKNQDLPETEIEAKPNLPETEKENNNRKILSDSNRQLQKDEFEAKSKSKSKKEEKENQITISYRLTARQVREGMKWYESVVTAKRKWLYTILAASIFLINLFDMIFRGNLSGYTYLFVGVSLAILFLVWYAPYRRREQIATAAEGENMEFQIAFDQNKIMIPRETGRREILYHSDLLVTKEQENQLLFCVEKKDIYIVPKKYFTENQLQKVKKWIEKANARSTENQKES